MPTSYTQPDSSAVGSLHSRLDAIVGRWLLRYGRSKAFNQGVNEGLRLAIDRIRHFEVGEYNLNYRNRIIAELAKELHR